MKETDFMRSELAGRLPVIYALQMKNPNSAVISMPLESKFDLEWIVPGNKPKYIEIKNRNCTSTAYTTAMFNFEKVDNNSDFGDDFYYVATYTDNKAIWFQPSKMPASGITEETKEIKKTFIDPNSHKITQRRMMLNFNDKYDEEEIPEITIKWNDDDLRRVQRPD